MIIKFFDGSEMAITEEQFGALKSAISDDEKWITINGNLIRLSAISTVRKAALPPAEHNRKVLEDLGYDNATN